MAEPWGPGAGEARPVSDECLPHPPDLKACSSLPSRVAATAADSSHHPSSPLVLYFPGSFVLHHRLSRAAQLFPSRPRKRCLTGILYLPSPSKPGCVLRQPWTGFCWWPQGFKGFFLCKMGCRGCAGREALPRSLSPAAASPPPAAFTHKLLGFRAIFRA